MPPPPHGQPGPRPDLIRRVPASPGSAPQIPLLAPSPNTSSRPPSERTHARELRLQRRREEGALGAQPSQQKSLPEGESRWPALGPRALSLRDRGLGCEQGPYIPSAPPWMECHPSLLQRLGQLSMMTHPLPRGDRAGPGLEMTLTPNLQGLPTAHGYFPTRPSAPSPLASPRRPGIFTHQQPLPVQAPGVSTRLSLSKHPLSLAPKTQKPHRCGSGLGGPGPDGGGLSL